MKKISLLKSLALLGAVGLTSVCVVETTLLLHKNSDPQVGDTIDLSVYDGYTLAKEIKYDNAPSNEEIKILLKDTGIQLNTEAAHKFDNINDLDVVVDGTTKTFSVTAKTNSPDYVGNSNAMIHYATPTKTNIASVINNTIVYLDDKFEDETLTKANILNSLKTSNPTLNINQLNVS
jgi:glycogen debranching enzyme